MKIIIKLSSDKYSDKDFINAFAQNVNTQIAEFPGVFIGDCPVRNVPLSAIRLNLGSEFFGSFELIDGSGITVLSADSLITAKYYIYASRSKQAGINIPVSEDDIKKSVSKYEKYIDDFIRQIMSAYSIYVPDGKRQHEAVNQIFTN